MNISKLSYFIIVCVYLSFFSSNQVCSSHESEPRGDDSMAWWCSTTPHPEPCEYFLGGSPHHFKRPKHKTEFREMLILVAMDRVFDAWQHARNLQPNTTSRRLKGAWNDCVSLHYDAIIQLNRTLHGLYRTKKNCTDFDAQTWLSTALTNLEVCRIGSKELNVSHFISPILAYNATQMVSNSLAINKGLMEVDSYFEEREGLPSWVSVGDRKLLASSTTSLRPNLVVAKDGSGNYRSVQQAINVAARRKTTGRFIIYVKRGVYGENIEVGYNVNNIMLLGDGMNNTIITGGRSVANGYTTLSSATASINGLQFIARGITFVNSAGPDKGQAVALQSGSDLSVYYQCAFQGYQDTLFVRSQRQFYRECYIYGTIDFVFGNAAVVFQNCIFYARKPVWGQALVVTAQGRTDPNQNTGIVIHNSRVVAADDLEPVYTSYQTYLGRPWMLYSRTVIMKSYMDSLVNPAGWLAWSGNYALNTLYYAEYGNFGPGSSTSQRVKWGGYHVITSASVASQFTVNNFIAGRSWLPATGVPFTSGL